MALIDCPDCKRQISPSAVNCPHCRPLQVALPVPNKKAPAPSEPETEANGRHRDGCGRTRGVYSMLSPHSRAIWWPGSSQGREGISQLPSSARTPSIRKWKFESRYRQRSSVYA